MTTLEQVEKLRAMANVSYDEAKAALDATNGDLLEAIILLEKQGKVATPSGGGYYSSQKSTDTNQGHTKKLVGKIKLIITTVKMALFLPLNNLEDFAGE